MRPYAHGRKTGAPCFPGIAKFKWGSGSSLMMHRTASWSRSGDGPTCFWRYCEADAGWLDGRCRWKPSKGQPNSTADVAYGRSALAYRPSSRACAIPAPTTTSRISARRIVLMRGNLPAREVAATHRSPGDTDSGAR